MTNNLFYEPRASFVAHTAESCLLVRDRGLRDWVGYTSEESFPASTKLVEATEKYGASEEKNETAYNIAFDTPLPMFEYLSHHKDRVERFAGTMGAMTATEGYNVSHLVNGFAWEEIGHGTVVDVCLVIRPWSHIRWANSRVSTGRGLYRTRKHRYRREGNWLEVHSPGPSRNRCSGRSFPTWIHESTDIVHGP